MKNLNETSSNSVKYNQNEFGRIVSEKRNVDGHGTYRFSYAYNGSGQLSKTTYPGGLEESYLYDNYGFKSQSAIGDKVIYKVESTDGLVSNTSFMGKLTTTLTRDARGYESNRCISLKFINKIHVKNWSLDSMEIVPIKNDTSYIYAIKLLESKLVVETILISAGFE